MKLISKLPFIFSLITSYNANAQSYLEFVQNKGQWDNNISFKANLSAGAFVLKPDGGYRAMQYNTTDLRTIANYYSHPTNTLINPGQNGPSTLSVVNNVNNSSSRIVSQQELILHSHTYEVKFLNANPHPQIIPDKPLNSYSNYFIGNDPTKWGVGCKVYQAVTYKNVYPNIDVRYYTSNGQLKYDFIVNPGGNPENISMYYDGVDGLKLTNGSLLIKTSVTEIKELLPYSYVLLKSGRKEVACNYELSGNIVHFKLENKKEDNSILVIDPSIVFVTFSGSKIDNWGYTATYDDLGNFYNGGIVFGTGFPANNGAFQQAFAGGTTTTGEQAPFDICIIKLDPTGKNRIYATYLGGSKGNEQPQSLVCDADGNLIIAGRTTSSDFPSISSSTKFGLGWDIILSKLDPTGGKLLGSVVLGGSGDDGLNIRAKYGAPASGAISINRNYGDDARCEVIVDAARNIYFASCSQSANFPISANAFQKTLKTNSNNTINQDAVIIKMTSDLQTVLLSSYLGGTGDDGAFAIALNPFDNSIYLAGGTSSTDFPLATNVFNGGLTDGFVSIISNTTTPQIIKSNYYGTSAIDVIYGIQFDKSGFPYIMGTTTGTWPTNNALFVQAGGKQFITKLQTDLFATIYSTVFGTPSASAPNISPTAFFVDRCENVYVAGWGGNGNTRDNFPSAGTAGLSVKNAIGNGQTDGSDFYFFVMERDAKSQLFGDFFGQVDNVSLPPLSGGTYPDHTDGGTSRFDKSGTLYQASCANCYGGTVYPTYPSGNNWSPINGTTQSDGVVSGCNMSAIKIAFNFASKGSSIISSVNGNSGITSGCKPLKVDFSDFFGSSKKYTWNFGDGSPDTTTLIPSISHYYSLPSDYNARLIGIDSNRCNIFDTSYVTIKVRDDSVSLKANVSRVGSCSSFTYQFDNVSTTTNLLKPFKSNSFRINFGDGTTSIIGNTSVQHIYAATGSYNASLVLLDSNYCNQYDSIIIPLRISTSLSAQFTTAASGCAPYAAVFTNTSSGGTSFKWQFGDGSILVTNIGNPITHVYNNALQYTIKLIANDSTACNKSDSISNIITVFASPTITGALIACVGSITQLIGSPSGTNLWTSSNTNIATITSSGFVSAISFGKTDIVYTSSNGCKADSIFTVNQSPLKPNITRDVNNNLVSSSALGNQWFSGPTPISGATSQTYKPSTEGAFSVQVTQNGCSSTKSDSYYYLVTAINNINNNEHIIISPNPVVNLLKIDFQLQNITSLTVEMIAMNGNKIFEKLILNGNSIDMSNYAMGNYTLRLIDNKTHKLVYTCTVLKSK